MRIDTTEMRHSLLGERKLLMRKTLVLAILTLFLGLTIAAPGDSGSEQYIKVEMKGIIETGIMSIGGETTGTIIRVNNVTWELDLGNQKDLQDAANLLHKKIALVTGIYQKRKGVEISERHVVTVTSLKPADAK